MRDLDTKLVVAVEDLKGTTTLGDKTVTMDENTINVKGESHVLCLFHLFSLNGLNLRDEELSGRLNGGHARAGRTTISMVNRRQTRLTLGSGNGEGSSKGVSGRSSVSHGGGDAQVVHVLGSLRDG